MCDRLNSSSASQNTREIVPIEEIDAPDSIQTSSPLGAADASRHFPPFTAERVFSSAERVDRVA